MICIFRPVTSIEPELLQLENLFVENSKKSKRGFRRNRKSCKSYVCQKNRLSNSDDENFWRVAMIHFDATENKGKFFPR